jgi:hypothetical protein
MSDFDVECQTCGTSLHLTDISEWNKEETVYCWECAHDKIKELSNPWNKVGGDKTPDHGQHVLCFWPQRETGYGGYYEKMTKDTIYWEANGFWMPGKSEYAVPTHWMPIPEDPE